MNVRIAPNLLQATIRVADCKVYELQTTLSILTAEVVQSEAITDQRKMAGAETGASISALIPNEFFDKESIEKGQVIICEMQKISLNLWRIMKML